MQNAKLLEAGLLDEALHLAVAANQPFSVDGHSSPDIMLAGVPKS